MHPRKRYLSAFLGAFLMLACSMVIADVGDTAMNAAQYCDQMSAVDSAPSPVKADSIDKAINSAVERISIQPDTEETASRPDSTASACLALNAYVEPLERYDKATLHL